MAGKEEKEAVATTPKAETEKAIAWPYFGMRWPFYGEFFGNPFRAMDLFFEQTAAEFNRQFGELEKRLEAEKTVKDVKVERKNSQYLVTFKTAKGIKPDELDVKYDKGFLSISYRAKNQSSVFEFAAELPGVDTSRIEAKCKDDNVTIDLPILAAYVPKKIAIKAE